jgi:hypothetical protein
MVALPSLLMVDLEFRCSFPLGVRADIQTLAGVLSRRALQSGVVVVVGIVLVGHKARLVHHSLAELGARGQALGLA